MPNGNLADEVRDLFVGVAKDIYGKFSSGDKAALEQYSRNVAQLTLKLATTSDPAAKARIVDNLKSYANATQLMVARYEIVAANEVEKAAAAALNLAVSALVKIVIAAL
jgi:hypothetical protein